MADIEALAARLDEAARTGRAIPQLSAETDIALADAYEIQRALIALRLQRGERRIGMKMGFTSRAKMAQMGVDDLIWGRLTDAMLHDDGGTVAFGSFVHPRVEPEIAYLLRKPLAGKVSALEALDAVEAVAPALEIIDSRYENFKFSLADVVADNSSSSGFVVGGWRRRDVDASNLGMVLSIDGRPAQFGSTAAILGDPLRSLVAAARMVASAGETLAAGSIILAGGATAAVALSPGNLVELEVEQLGSASFSMNG
ncbi:MAG TPA: fumarylacetoacetate hydrolase family protein [Allosphingosinicella sp.]|nr:fumarylacetoacetate hydrolase family protein [Allosphingosinicella sp.]